MALSAKRASVLLPLFEDLLSRCQTEMRVGFDPIEFPRRFSDPADIEVAGLVAASLAYGRADLFKPQLERIFRKLGPSPAAFCERFVRSPDVGLFNEFQYRFNQPPDIAALLAAIGQMRHQHGSLGARFARLYRKWNELRPALAEFARELRTAPVALDILGRANRPTRGFGHLLPDASQAGASKRWNMYLRWMVRGPDAVDFGIWKGLPASALVVPLDTHVARIAGYLGLVLRKSSGWKAAAELTESFRQLDATDPVRFDFALCHLGMSGGCTPQRDPERCAVCPLAGECRARS